MIGKRMKELLGKAADVFEKGMSPFEHWFLSENEVTADECMAMLGQIATIIKWFVGRPRGIQAKVLFHDMGPLAEGLAARIAYEDALQAADAAIGDALQAIDETLEEQEPVGRVMTNCPNCGADL